MFFNPDFSVIDAAIVKDPKLGDLIMIVKNENSNPPEKNLRVTRTKKIEKGFPTKVSALLQESIGRKDLLLFLSVIRFMFISINTVIIVMVPFAL